MIVDRYLERRSLIPVRRRTVTGTWTSCAPHRVWQKTLCRVRRTVWFRARHWTAAYWALRPQTRTGTTACPGTGRRTAALPGHSICRSCPPDSHTRILRLPVRTSTRPSSYVGSRHTHCNGANTQDRTIHRRTRTYNNAVINNNQ